MANVGDIKASYDAVEELWLSSMSGMFGKDVLLDITCARYNGDYNLPYLDAQKNKQRYILEQIKFKKGDRVLDIGSGWGPMLKTIDNQGGHSVGITLSPTQVKYCRQNKLEAFLLDWKEITAKKKNNEQLSSIFSKPFNSIISVGAFEHFCSIKELKAGKQDKIYREFFRTVYELLESSGILYLQTMIWGGRGVPDLNKDIDSSASLHSLKRIYGQWIAYFPGSWLPNNEEQIVAAANPYFDLMKCEDSRLDYVETARVWLEAINAPGGFRKRMAWLKFLTKGLIRPELIARYRSLREDAFSRGFAYDMIGHRRLTFKKRKVSSAANLGTANFVAVSLGLFILTFTFLGIVLLVE